MPGTILIVDDLPSSRIVLKAWLESARHATLMAQDQAAGLALARSHRPAAILLSLERPGSGDAALAGSGAAAVAGFLAALRADPATAEIPLVAILPPGTTGRDRLVALRAGAEDVLPRPLAPDLLLARLRSLLRNDALAVKSFWPGGATDVPGAGGAGWPPMAAPGQAGDAGHPFTAHGQPADRPTHGAPRAASAGREGGFPPAPPGLAETAASFAAPPKGAAPATGMRRSGEIAAGRSHPPAPPRPDPAGLVPQPLSRPGGHGAATRATDPPWPGHRANRAAVPAPAAGRPARVQRPAAPADRAGPVGRDEHAQATGGRAGLDQPGRPETGPVAGDPGSPLAAAGRIGVVALQAGQAARWHGLLAPLLRAAVIPLLPDQALDPGRPVCDVYLIDSGGPDAPLALRLVPELRARPATRHAALCPVIAPSAAKAGAMVLDLGADALISAPLEPEETALRLAAQLARKKGADNAREAVQQTLRLAFLDPLTSLANRRHAEAELARLARGAACPGTNAGLAVLLIDIDRFKGVNDRWGHSAGDAVLVEVAARLRAAMRPGDLLARIGGEEFLAALPDTSAAAAHRIARGLCARVARDPVVVPAADQPIRVTLSIGLAHSQAPGQDTEPAALIAAADRALLSAKVEGRNQVTVARSAA